MRKELQLLLLLPCVAVVILLTLNPSVLKSSIKYDGVNERTPNASTTVSDQVITLNFSIANPNHWRPDWSLQDDMGKLLIQRRLDIAKRCKKFRHYQFPWKNRGLPRFARLQSVEICLTAKAGSLFWRTFVLAERDTELTKHSKHVVRFVVSRNPWHRLVSAWSDKLFGKGHYNWMREMCDGKYWKYAPPFSVFIEECVLKLWRNNRTANIHWMPVIDRCRICDGHLRYDFIIATENMNKEAAYMLEKYAGITDAYERLGISRNASMRLSERQQVTASYQKHYVNVSDENVQLLRHMYKHEIYLFGYPDTPFVDFEQS